MFLILNHNNSFIQILHEIIMRFKLESCQHENGLFPASIGSKNKLMNEYFWIRDNYYVYLAADSLSKLKIIRAFQKIADYNKKLEKFDYKPLADFNYIHPRYNKKLEEIPGGWAWVQNDSVGNLLEVLSQAKDKYYADKLVKYLATIEFWSCPDSGFWEEGKELRSSSLAACLRGLESYENNFGDNRKTREMLNKGYESLKSILPNETPTRKSDLALLSLIYPGELNHNIITKELKQKIIENVIPLVRDYGIIRYHGDKWNGADWSLGEGKEMQWTMGLPWLYLCTGQKEYLEKTREIKLRYGTMPEGIVDGNPNCTSCLFWSEAMYKIAEKKFSKHEI